MIVGERFKGSQEVWMWIRLGKGKYGNVLRMWVSTSRGACVFRIAKERFHFTSGR